MGKFLIHLVNFLISLDPVYGKSQFTEQKLINCQIIFIDHVAFHGCVPVFFHQYIGDHHAFQTATLNKGNCRKRADFLFAKIRDNIQMPLKITADLGNSKPLGILMHRLLQTVQHLLRYFHTRIVIENGCTFSMVTDI